MGVFTASLSDTALSVSQQASFQDTTHLLLYNSSTFQLNRGASMDLSESVFFICNNTGTQFITMYLWYND